MQKNVTIRIMFSYSCPFSDYSTKKSCRVCSVLIKVNHMWYHREIWLLEKYFDMCLCLQVHWLHHCVIHNNWQRNVINLNKTIQVKSVDTLNNLGKFSYDIVIIFYWGQTDFSNSKDISSFFRYLDFIGLMEYDYHGIWDGYTGYNTPLFPSPGDITPEQKSWNIVSYNKYFIRILN